ncbi:hypothetical protein O7626_08585 [Micromonospora sp. WMMD1102]|uniref:hypothetical protein n=1 Tax=Micromonospora sp. WMMD1102 TaxID=3016105 RepID=UPI0024153215|nr:hypothetical protein [Micromonospora sp. WMMD1102]MDG4785980.1 hypothetical protein [Micromonospora sp. WMMD1102]
MGAAGQLSRLHERVLTAPATGGSQPEPTRPAADPPLRPRPGSRVTVVPLSIVAKGEGFVVGSADHGMFVEVPPVAVAAIELLRAGHTIAQASADLRADIGEDIDVLDFVGTLIDLGFVSHIDGVAQVPDDAAGARAGRRPRWVQGPPPGAVRWLFGPVAWAVYALAAVVCVTTLAVHPAYRISSDAFFFLDDPVTSLALLSVTAFVLAAAHEAFHWLAACREGVAARFAISRRLYFLVFETDLTQLWSLPPGRRYGPMLAGMALDSVLLAVTLGGRATIDAGLVAAPGVARFLEAIAAVLFLGLCWQLCFFMRTDIYAVVATALNCTNLWRVTMLTLARRFHVLGTAGRRELASAAAVDLRVARWYGWLCLAGFAVATWFAAVVIVPALWKVIDWTTQQAVVHGLASPRFWCTVLLALLTLLPRLLTVGLFARQVTTWVSNRKRTGAAVADAPRDSAVG